uniref:Uncharacterized protein n=1 Tax=Kalanchoe fedtschenkoi TaxID=63787 RepID=A0A7N0VCP4_KALFE
MDRNPLNDVVSRIFKSQTLLHPHSVIHSFPHLTASRSHGVSFPPRRSLKPSHLTPLARSRTSALLVARSDLDRQAPATHPHTVVADLGLVRVQI